MSSAAFPLAPSSAPQSKTNPEECLAPERNIDNEADDDMATRRLTDAEEEERIIRIVRRIRLEEPTAHTNGNKQFTYLLGVMTIATVLGQGGSFLTSLGITVGSKAHQAEIYYKQSDDDHKTLETLFKLYMLHFSEDPQSVDLNARQQEKDRQRLHEQLKEETKPKRR